MSVLVCDSLLADRLIAERRASGGDRFDEVWEGVYVMSPLANNEHRYIATRLVTVLSHFLLVPEEGQIFAGCNVSDRIEQWEHNYRCPDVAVFLPTNPARDCGTHWFGGPDLAVEITSKGDRSREKLDFYDAIGVRELLIVERDPWQLELFQRVAGSLRSVGVLTPEDGARLASAVLPLALRLRAGKDRPRIEVADADGKRSWLI